MHAPVYEALERLKRRRVVPFDVPGHKRGRGNPELVELLGEKCVSLDVNSMAAAFLWPSLYAFSIVWSKIAGNAAVGL